jgi:maf-like protein
MEPIILASKSPQRQDILKRLNIPFISIPSEADESVDLSLSPEKAVR